MPKWEYMFVRLYKGQVMGINGLEFKKPIHPIWEEWLIRSGLDGWELASEVSFAPLSVHATLKRQIPEKK